MAGPRGQEKGQGRGGGQTGTLNTQNATPDQLDALAIIRETLAQYGIDNIAIANEAWRLIKDGFGDSPTYIIQQLREMEQYQAYFPELKLRANAGLKFMSEGEIIQWRQGAQELARTYYGTELTVQDMANAIGNDLSLGELKHRFEVLDAVKTRGGPLKQWFSQVAGINLDDASLAEFLDPEFETAELDDLFERGMYSAAPAVLFGNNLLPENLTGLLRQHGIGANQAFENYQRVSSSLPQFQRLMAIDGILGDVEQTGNDLFNSTPFSTLFRAIQLGDQSALMTLQQTMARETARFSQQGGVAGGGKGLLSAEDRRRIQR